MCVCAIVPPTPSVSIMSISRSVATTSRGVKVDSSRSRLMGQGAAGGGLGSLATRAARLLLCSQAVRHAYWRHAQWDPRWART